MSTSGGQEIKLLVVDREKAKHQTTNKIESTRSQHITNNDIEVSHGKREEIAEPLSLAGVQELRGVLSEALNTSLFKFAVVIVFVFNFSYSLFNSFRQDGAQDESNDGVANKCHFNGRHKTFYVTLILTSAII